MTAVPHRPGPGRFAPSSTYRLQLQPGFTFADAAGQVDYLARLGVSHVYLSPVLQALPGSTHAYDVVDHTRISEDLGGLAGFEALVDRLHAAGMGVVVDVVPNHMTVPTPAYLNGPLWSLLREGPASSFADWFDVDWASEDGRILMPVLEAPLEEVLAAGELSVRGDGGAGRDESVLRYFAHEFPVRPGTEMLELADLVAAQPYRLADWRESGTHLNYRRFFDVTSLIAVRVQEPEVFEATHRVLLDLMQAGAIDGLRIDHPDGLADPRGYLARLADASGDAWVVAEKILEGGETLPDDWRCAGTTGYDALLRVGGVFVDTAGATPLTELLREVTGGALDLDDLVAEAKEQVVREAQAAEVNRLMRLVQRILPDLDAVALRRALNAVLIAMDRYRAYVVPGEPASREARDVVDGAVERAGARLGSDERAALGELRDLALGMAAVGGPQHPDLQAEFVVRFQQVCGPVMAKAVEDTAFYRYPRLTGLNEVGGDPAQVGVSPAELHSFSRRLIAEWPTTMTTLSTHDTKRSEDVRARLAVLSERPADWAAWLRDTRKAAAPYRARGLDAETEYLLWQTLVGAWPISARRLEAYALKAVREAKRRTRWAEPDELYEQGVADFVTGILSDRDLIVRIEQWVDATAEPVRAVTLGQKLLQLTMPGVPDVYQGNELVDLSLVDPDNRRPIDYEDRHARLNRLEGGGSPRDLSDEKLLVTARTLELRRRRPDWFTGETAVYEPIATTTEHALAIGRGAGQVQAIAMVTRLASRLAEAGGWGINTMDIPAGTWRDALSGKEIRASDGGLAIVGLLDQLPVALLVRTGD